MPDPDEIVAFLLDYVAECDAAGAEPLPVRELAQLLELVVAGAGFEPSTVGLSA